MTVKYFGFALADNGFDDPLDPATDTNYVAEVASFTNLNQMAVFTPADDIVARLQWMADHGGQAMLSVQSIFFEGASDVSTGSGTRYTLFPDYVDRWGTFLATNAAAVILQIGAFYIADEPVWNGISAVELQIACDLVKRSFPDIPVVIIEAWPVISQMVVPTSADWIGWSHYAIPDPQHSETFLAELAAVKAKRTRRDQKIIMVMDTQWLPLYGDAGFQPEDMAAVATSYWDLAQSDADVIAIMGYLLPGGFDDAEQLGAREMPQNVIDEYVRIGQLIKGNTHMDEYAGQGGSYAIDAYGEKVLVARTDADINEETMTQTLLSAATGTGAGTSYAAPADKKSRTYIASVAGSGSVSATVLIEVSNDNVIWATRATITIGGTGSASDLSVDDPSPFPFVRANVTAISGSGAAVTVSVSVA